MKVTPVDWNALRGQNPIDYIPGGLRGSHKLATLDGQLVILTRASAGSGFILKLPAPTGRVEVGGNLELCYLLNVHQVGIVQEA